MGHARLAAGAVDAGAAYDPWARVVPTLPGEDLVERGLADLREGRESVASLAILAARPRPRLERAGVAVGAGRVAEPSHRLYALLEAETPGRGHGRHHAILRRLSSDARAVEHARGG